jgi:hypothetical protein
MGVQEAQYSLPFGFAKAAVQFKGADDSATITATGGVFTAAGHGLSVGDVVVFSSITTTTGITTYTKYYVISSGLTTDEFKVSATSGGSTVSLTGDGSATFAKMFEVRLRMANKITSTGDKKDTNYEGDNVIIKQTNTQSVGFTFDADSFPIGAHALLFGSSEVTSGLPDSYTSAYGLMTATERTGKTCSFWGEGTSTSFDADGVQSSKTVRVWYPLGTITPTKSPELTTSDKPAPWQYTFNTTEMSPTVDVMGVALPVTGAPVIYMEK